MKGKTRREFLGTAAVAGSGALLGSGIVGTETSLAADRYDAFRAGDFESLLGGEFVFGERKPFKATLVEVTQYPEYAATVPSEVRRPGGTSFSLVFKGPHGALPESDSCPVTHRSLGTRRLHVVPIVTNPEVDPDSQLFEIVFG